MNTYRSIQLTFSPKEIIAALKATYPGNLAVQAIRSDRAGFSAEGGAVIVTYGDTMGPRYNELSPAEDDGPQAA